VDYVVEADYVGVLEFFEAVEIIVWFDRRRRC
jgi:hypothetical protein